jgi:hypothetical protein
MKDTETVLLTEYVVSCCPQQAKYMGEYTPDAWHHLLGDLSFEDCQAAVVAIAKRQPFVAPAEIRAEVTRIRSARIGRSLIPPPPPELTDDTAAYQRVINASTRLAGDGLAPLAGPEPLAIAAGRQARREKGLPVTLGSAIAELRARLGPARTRRPLGDLPAVARDQVAKARAERERREAS